jgi:hypothetical protein
MGVAGTVATGLSAMGGGLAANLAGATHHEQGGGNAGGEVQGMSGSAAREAMAALLDTVGRTQARLLSPEAGYTDLEEIGEGQRSMAHILQTALAFWLEADPERPVFQPYVTPTRKLLGDNPDSIYYFAPIRDDRTYRIRGNVGAATFTSFTVESGSHDGHAARSSVAAISPATIMKRGNVLPRTRIALSRSKSNRSIRHPSSPGAETPRSPDGSSPLQISYASTLRCR